MISIAIHQGIKGIQPHQISIWDEIRHDDIKKLFLPFCEIIVLITWFGGFMLQKAPTAVLQEHICWKYAIMMSKKLFFNFCEIIILITWFDPFYTPDRLHLAVLCSCRRPQQSSKRQHAGIMPSWYQKKKIAFAWNNDFKDMIWPLLSTWSS